MVRKPDALTPEYMFDHWPYLYHMAEAGSWPSIQRYGLRSTTALLDLFEVSGKERVVIEAERRPESVVIHHPVHGTAVIRDNKPIISSVLRRTLVGMSEEEWYRTLNKRVYFWLSKKRLDGMRNASAYQARRHDVLVLSTERLLSAYSTAVELSPMNSGAVHAGAKHLRGVGTFRPIADYPWLERRCAAPQEPVVELTVPYMVEDLDRLLVDVSTL